MTSAVRSLIVNADDLGQTSGINRGILRGIGEGIITSASLMVRWPPAAEAVGMLREHPHVSIGLHLDLGEWNVRDGQWHQDHAVVDAEDADAVGAEVDRQLGAFLRLVGRAPTHLDSHQHVHSGSPVREVVLRAGRALGIPVRGFGDVRYEGGFYGQSGPGRPFPQGISHDSLAGIIRKLPPGVTELGCHPGVQGDSSSMYCHERAVELRVLCAPAVRQVLGEEGVVLRSFHDLVPPGDA